MSEHERVKAMMEALSRAHLTDAALAEDLGWALRPFVLTEVRESVVDALSDLMSLHPYVGKAGTHWDGCWKVHPECAIQKCIETVNAVTAS